MEIDRRYLIPNYKAVAEHINGMIGTHYSDRSLKYFHKIGKKKTPLIVMIDAIIGEYSIWFGDNISNESIDKRGSISIKWLMPDMKTLVKEINIISYTNYSALHIAMGYSKVKQNACSKFAVEFVENKIGKFDLWKESFAHSVNVVTKNNKKH